MNENSKNPLFAVPTCEYCVRKATDFTVIMCEPCAKIWTKGPARDTIKISLAHLQLVILRINQNDIQFTNMSPEFAQAILLARQKRLKKLDLFHKTHKIQQSMLLKPYRIDTKPYEVEPGYTNIKEIQENLNNFRNGNYVLLDESLESVTPESQ